MAAGIVGRAEEEETPEMDASASLCFARRAFESANHCFFSASAPASSGAVEHAFFDAGFDAETRVAETRVAETRAEDARAEDARVGAALAEDARVGASRSARAGDAAFSRTVRRASSANSMRSSNASSSAPGTSAHSPLASPSASCTTSSPSESSSFAGEGVSGPSPRGLAIIRFASSSISCSSSVFHRVGRTTANGSSSSSGASSGVDMTRTRACARRARGAGARGEAM